MGRSETTYMAENTPQTAGCQAFGADYVALVTASAATFAELPVVSTESSAVADAERMAETHLARTAEVDKVGSVVRWMEDLVRVPGTKFGIGLDALLGFMVPGVGDAVTGAVALSLLVTAMRRGVPRIVVLRMFLNIAVDVVVGLVPVVGDAFDLVWRSNVRNLELLERHQGELEPKARAGDYAIVTAAIALVAGSVAAPIFAIGYLLGLVL